MTNDVSGVSGIPVLLLHMERKRLSPALDNVVHRNMLRDKENIIRVIVGNTSYEVHPSFRLYMSTATPLLLHG